MTVAAVIYVVVQDAFPDRTATPKGSFLRDIETSFTIGLLVYPPTCSMELFPSFINPYSVFIRLEVRLVGGADTAIKPTERYRVVQCESGNGYY